MNRGGRRIRGEEQRDPDEGWRMFRPVVWHQCSTEQKTAVHGCREVFDATLAEHPGTEPGLNVAPTPAKGISPFIPWNMPSVLPGVDPHHRFSLQYKGASQMLWAYASQAHNSIPILNRCINRCTDSIAEDEDGMVWACKPCTLQFP